ncbi:MAG: hypothetical protein QG674_30 [Patescibacteria group bacterium]|nr:hypothetical protein [Patescibacteria group bacterium]
MKTKRITLNAQLQTWIELRLYCLDGAAEIKHSISTTDFYYAVRLPDSFDYANSENLAAKAKSKTKFENGYYRFGSNRHSNGEMVFAYQVYRVTQIVDDRSSFGHTDHETRDGGVALTQKIFIADTLISREEMKKQAAWVRKMGRRIDRVQPDRKEFDRLNAEFVGRRVSRSTPYAVSTKLQVYPKQKLFVKIGVATFAPLVQRKYFQPW